METFQKGSMGGEWKGRGTNIRGEQCAMRNMRGKMIGRDGIDEIISVGR